MTDTFEREKIQLYSAGVLTYSDVAPFLDELNKRHMFVEAQVSNHEPPAAGMSEIALTLLVASTAVPYLRSFFSTWAEEDARQLRAEILNLLDRGRKSKSGRKFSPLQVVFARSEDLDRLYVLNRVRFHFHRALTEQEFLLQLDAAQDYMNTLPDEAFEGSGGPTENSLFWDEDLQTWRGVVTGFRDDAYFPPGFWE